LHILHIWDQAGVAFILAKFQRKNGDQSKVIRVKGPDKYGIDEFYRNNGLFVTTDEFVRKSIAEAKKADVIHIHSLPEMVINIRKIYGKSKIIILHYHGTDIRGLKENVKESNFCISISGKKLLSHLVLKRRHIKGQRFADKVIVSTPDLLHLVRGSVWLPNPVDTDHFNCKLNGKKSTSERALLIHSEPTDTKLAIDFCKHKGLLNIETHDRTKNPISHKDLPKFFENYDIYLDLRFVNGELLQNLSLTALQALASGLRVLNHNLNFIDNLPLEHYPVNVVTKLSSIYSQKKKKNYSVLAKLILEQFPLDIIYFFYFFIKNWKQKVAS